MLQPILKLRHSTPLRALLLCAWAAALPSPVAAAGLMPPPAPHAEALGRLFFTPAERHRAKATTARTDADEAPAPPPRLDGIITRSAGRPTLFLDGCATLVEPRQVHIDSASAQVRGADGRRHRLQVGEISSAARP